jgi:hypothetical protein
MSKKITPVPLSRMPVLEYPELVYTFDRIIDQYDANTMFINDSATELKARMPELMRLKVPEGKNTESAVIQALFGKRRDIIGAMVGQTRKLVKANLSGQVEQLKLVVPFIETYWSNIRSFNEKIINARIKLMLAEIDSSTELKNALTSVGLSMHIDELKTIENDLFTSKENRRLSKSEMPKVDSKQIKSYVGEAVNDVINAIEIARKAHPEVDYAPMIKEINELFVSYQSEIKAHSTRVKNASTAAATAPKPTTPTV